MASQERLIGVYRQEVAPALMKEFGYKSSMAVPRMSKIIVNMGVGAAKDDIKILDAAVDEMGLITGQKPAITRARKSIANFKLRENMPIGCRVTLRGRKMYEFYDRLVNIALPRVRDFRGVSTRSFDGRGNYTLGITDSLIFPELGASKVERIKGMNITIVTTAQSDNEARALLSAMGMPFRKAA
jgi:large subunit ribosomal protein L5